MTAERKIGGDTGECADQHQSFCAEREHAGALADNQSERRKRIRDRERREIGQPAYEDVLHGSASTLETNAMANEEFRRGDAHDDDRLDHLHHRKRYLIEDLKALAGDEQHGDENGDDRRGRSALLRARNAISTPEKP